MCGVPRDERANAVTRAFFAGLDVVDAQITQHEKSRWQTYEYLLPKNVLNSISIRSGVRTERRFYPPTIAEAGASAVPRSSLIARAASSSVRSVPASIGSACARSIR